ncbi:MAG: Ppx/GppA family phosphatase [Solirubrobacteraceae bacterium]|jgi:exopolyphosphatase/guanosine-5'-triphosphate,3'-diphosphate pyrophosphatase
MRTAVVDIGTNSTRLLIADVAPDGEVAEIVRRSVVTRLGAGVDAGGELSQEGCERVYAALAEFRAEIDAHRPGDGNDGGVSESGESEYPNLAVMTSAVRDARNGRTFAEHIRSAYGLDARVLTGEEEARMTFLGAMSGRPAHDAQTPAEPTVVIDIGGGSTEFIVGSGHTAGFHVSLPAGVVRMSERHIHSDPPAPAELQALAADVRSIFLAGLPAAERAPVTRGIAVAGTATSAAAIDQELDPYDPARVHGYTLLLATVEMLLARLADMDEAQRRTVAGLHPDRAPTIVAGMVLLSEAMRAFELDEVEVSEHDILYGGALSLAVAG